MSNSASQTKAEAVRSYEIGNRSDLIEFSINLPEDNVSRILSASASVVIDKHEALLGELSFSGEACLNIIYSLNDGTISNYKTCQDFSRKIEDLMFDPSVLVSILPKVIDVSVEQGNGNTIKVKISLENEFSLLKNQEINIFQNKENDVFVKESEMQLTKQKERNCYDFKQTSVFETKLPVGKILNVTSGAVITKADALDGTIVFEGETITRLLYSTADDRPLLVSLFNKDLFREEVENSNVAQENLIQATIDIIGNEIEEKFDEETKNVEILIPIKICYDVFESENVVVVGDAYSTKTELNLSTEAFVTTNIVGNETFTNKLDGNISLGEETPRIDKILAIDGICVNSINEKIENGEYVSNGTIRFNLIYLNDDEENINSISLEFPYEINEKINKENVVRYRSANQVIDLDATVKRGREVYIDGKLKTTLWLVEEVEKAVVCNATKGEELKQRDGALEIYFASEGQTFWNVAKDLKVSQELLKQQNPEIVEPFVKNEKIVFFDQYQIEIE